MNQVFVIATSTRVDISKVDVSHIDDAYFAKEKKPKKTAEDKFFDQEPKVTLRCTRILNEFLKIRKES